MGVPPKLNSKWLAAIKKARSSHSLKMKEVHSRVAFVPYDEHKKQFTKKMKEKQNDIYLVDESLIHFNQYSGRLGAYTDVSKNYNQDNRSDFNKIKNRNLVNPQITKEESSRFQKRLRAESQQQVAIAQADGVLIDGNRRFANLLEIGTNNIYVYFLPENIPDDDLEKIEGHFSFLADTRIKYTDYLRAHQILKKIETMQGTQSRSEEEFQKALGKSLEQLDEFLQSIDLSKDGARKLVNALREGQLWCKKNGFMHQGKPDTDVLEDKARTGKDTPGFEVFTRMVTGVLTKVKGRTPNERSVDRNKIRKTSWCAINPKIKGRGADRLDKVKAALGNAKKKEHIYKDAKIFKGDQAWKKPATWDDLEKQIAISSVTLKTVNVISKIKNAGKYLEQVKLSEIKSEHKKELNPVVKKMKTKLAAISQKVS